MSTAEENILYVRDVSLFYRKRKSFFRHDSYQVLDSITFTINKGETLGVIGRNGCGKSSLLKILAGIYQPDLGDISHGNISVSLLSLSLGFDGELTGWDNALLSGMLLGFSKDYVKSVLSDVVTFSELSDFIHEPIKTYSSGMRMRLGFSLALYLKPDILLIDEVLGVGDAHFRQKAESAMRNRINSDATVVLVSHSATQIISLCDRVIWLENGSIKLEGNPESVLMEYESFITKIKGVGKSFIGNNVIKGSSN